MVSSFLASKGWGGSPELTALLYCNQCGFRFYDRGLSAAEARNYYDGYRSEEYYQTRRKYEIFYTRRLHEDTGNWLASASRKRAVVSALEQAAAPKHFASALDFGGGTGHMLQGIDAQKKAVFDFSNEEPAPGVELFTDRNTLPSGWDLILSCQCLEHLSDPSGEVKQIAQLISSGGWFYAEVPDQIWKDTVSPKGLQKAWLSWLVKHPIALHAADIYSTGCRVKFSRLPPLGFVPMREHVNFFTVSALRELLTRAGLNVRWSGRNLEQSICAVATRD